MGRTWLIRGIVVAVIAVLVGAWTVEVSGLRDPDGPSKGKDTSSSSEESEAPETDLKTTVDRRTTKSPRVRKVAQPSEPDETTTGPSPAVEEPADEPTTRTPSPSDPPTTAEPTPVDEDPDASSPPPPPTPTPDEPDDECTDLLGVLDCVLNPVTSAP